MQVEEQTHLRSHTKFQTLYEMGWVRQQFLAA
jgi:hypothetical protein